jgi:hypothetical protein
MAHFPLLWNGYPIKKKHRLDLVFAPCLFPPHAQASPDQAAVLQSPPRRRIDPFDVTPSKTPGQFAAIDPIPLVPSLLILGRYIRRIGHDIVNPSLPQLVMDPETTITRFVHRMVPSPRKMTLQVLNQSFCLGPLAKRLVLTVFGKNAHTPALFVDIQTDINSLTRKIKSATLNITHGKPPFGEFLRGTKNYIRKIETCLSFF